MARDAALAGFARARVEERAGRRVDREQARPVAALDAVGERRTLWDARHDPPRPHGVRSAILWTLNRGPVLTPAGVDRNLWWSPLLSPPRKRGPGRRWSVISHES